MRAARIHNYASPLVIDDIPRPTPGPGQVLVRIAGSGFCHSDLHIIDGDLPILPRMPYTLGHENAGYIDQLGESATAFAVGDPVVVYGGWGCGVCDMCVTGREQLCRTPRWAGVSDLDGGYAEYLLVQHERYLVPLHSLEPRDAAVYADAALTPYRAVKRALPFMTPDVPVLVIGIGGLGQFGVKLLRELTGSEIIAVDVDEAKLQTAKEYGATYALDARDADTAERIREISGGFGVAAAFDFVGADSTLQLAFAVTRSGGKVTQVGLAGGAVNFTLFTEVPFEVTFEGTLWGSIQELREVVALAECGRLTPIELEFVPLDEIQHAYEMLKAGKVAGRIVIMP